MAFHGTKGTFQFDVDSSIPQKENEIQGDSRYTREFKRNESIVIRVPLGSGLMTERGGVYDTFSVPYSEVVVWNIGYFPTPLKVPHNPETYFFDDGGDVAAPVFSETVQQTLRMLGLQPDRAVKPQVVAKAEPESF